jgi:predicted PolB exonuclease-like 3'-5' exonuclease
MLGHTPEASLPFAMFRTIAPTVWAFDCEWVPDADAGRRLLALAPDTPEPEVFEAMWTAAGASPEQPRPFLKLLHCRLASVAVVERRVCASGSAGSEIALRLCSLPREGGDTESDLLTAFFEGLDRRRPQLVGFNSHGADLPILAQRGLVLGLAAPGLCRRPDRSWEGPDYFHPHNDWNVDLMRAVGGRGAACPSLRDLAVLAGIPAKTHGDGPCSGGDVADLWRAGRRDDIRRYNECDAVTTYLLWLRTARFAGLLSATEHAGEEGRVEALLERHAERGDDHLGAFLERWRCLAV